MIVTALDARTAALVGKLEDAWDWLEANPDHPDFHARELLWIAWLREYEAAVDAERTIFIGIEAFA